MPRVAINPSDPNNNLLVDGTSGDDSITLTRGTTSNSIAVRGNGVPLGEFAFSGRILIDGADTIVVDSQVTRTTLIFGGIGADVITGGRTIYDTRT